VSVDAMPICNGTRPTAACRTNETLVYPVRMADKYAHIGCLYSSGEHRAIAQICCGL
jgi:hypothetical protein